jgi:hypothetical protein
MAHLILLGDSIFDNARYVPERPPVIEQVRQRLPAGDKATLLAIDGHTTTDVPRQFEGLPADSTHLFISVGGNDALGEIGIMGEPVRTVAEAIELFREVQERFRTDYHALLHAVLALEKPTTVCTVYDAIPGLGEMERTALSIFNDVILRSAFLGRLPIIDLRQVCGEASDYSPISPIEPSFTGGAKIARAIVEVATQHDFTRRQSVVYG